MKLIAIFILISLSCNAYSQEIDIKEYRNYDKLSNREKLSILNQLWEKSKSNSTYTYKLEVLDKFIDLFENQPTRQLQYIQMSVALADYNKNNADKKKYLTRKITALNRMNSLEDAMIAAREKQTLLIGELSEESLLNLNEIGNIYFTMKNFPKALEVYTDFFNLNKKVGSAVIQNAYFINSSMVFSEQGKYKDANNFLLKSLQVDEGYKTKKPYVYNALANNYLKLKNISIAEKYALEGLKAADGLSENLKISHYKTLSELYSLKNDYKLQHYYYKKFAEYSIKEDSVKSERLKEFIELDYLNQQNTLKIDDLSLNLQNQKLSNRLLLLGIISLIIIVGLSSFLYLSVKRSRSIALLKNKEIELINRGLEQKITERTSDLVKANEELVLKNAEITEALFKGKSMERERVAAELHDNLGSTLAALKWRLNSLNSEELNSSEKAIYEGIKNMMNSAYNEVRSISHNLIPKELQNGGLVSAVKKLIDDLSENSKIIFTLKTLGDFEKLGNNLSFELYSIILELITNVLKHSNATQAEILLEASTDSYKVIIKDNGLGFMKSQVKGKGLKNIEARVNRISGSISITSSSQFKSIFTINLPN